MGKPVAAARRATQLLDSLKLGEGKYKDRSVRSPDDSPMQFFSNPDKLPCQVRKLLLGNFLLELLQKDKPDCNFTFQRAEATIWANKRPLCSVKILSESEARISWADSRRIGLGIELATIDPLFAQAVLKKEKWT